MSKLPEIRKFVAPEIITGIDVRLFASQYIENFGIKKVLVVTDLTIEKQSWFKDIINNLNENEISYSIFNAVSPNPQDVEVMAGTEIFNQSGCKGFLAIGGGSVIDCAKGIAIVSANGGHINDFEGVDEVKHSIPPLICIPTTAGTSADVSQFSIIRDMNRLVKIAIISKAIVPDVSLIDPTTSYSMDNYLTACTGLDALTHAFEAFVSRGSSLITDNHALHSIKLIVENLPLVIKNGDNKIARHNMMIGSLEAGLAFSNASLGAVHAMAHSLGGYYDFAHGECNALLIDHVLNYNFDSEPDKYKKIGEVIGLDFRGLNTSQSNRKMFNYLRSFKEEQGIKNTLESLGTHKSDLSLLSEFSHNDPCLLTNPKEMNVGDLEFIFKEAL